MRGGNRVSVIIPCLNEERAIAKVIMALPAWVDEVIVVDNGSTDATTTIAANLGARVVSEPRLGYGAACLKGISSVKNPDIVVFIDGDFSDYPEEADLLVDPIIAGKADLVIGSRIAGTRQVGALTPQALFGNWLACNLIQLLWKVKFTDLGPFRAIRFSALQRLRMRDPDYGWTVEMQIKAAREGLRCLEVPVSYRRRLGRSKVSGTLKGAVSAGIKILSTILFTALKDSLAQKRPEEIVMLFCRYPEPGNTKTRLVPALGTKGASGFHKLLTEVTVSKILDFKLGAPRMAFQVHYTGGNATLMSEWLGPGLEYVKQSSGDLGQRMNTAFSQAFAKGATRVILVGSDVPNLSSCLLNEALVKLRSHELVLGPSEDGGYYLIGLNRPFESVFAGIPWGTATVMQQTIRIARDHGLSFATLTRLRDIDRPTDLILHQGRRLLEIGPSPFGTETASTGSISVIIPTLNEEACLAETMATVTNLNDVEVIVVDGGSTDKTVEIASAHDATVLYGPKGRGVQMNLGALVARGDYIVFLHADTLLPEGWVDHVRHEMQRPGIIAGAFSLRIDSDWHGLRLIELLANLRSRLFGMPYGDQAIFMKAETFRSLGGFPNQPIMEDFDLMRRLRKIGKIRTAPAAAITSARRWKRRGLWTTTAINQILIAAHLLGFSHRTLARLHTK